MQLTEHFTSAEAGWESIPRDLRPNALATLALLERVRGALGVPLRITSLYRSPARNATLAGASRTSQHLDATAVDFVALGLDYGLALARAVKDGGLRRSFGQFIAYKSRSHFHVSLPIRGTLGEVLEQSTDEAGAVRYAHILTPLPPHAVVAGAPAPLAPLVAGLIAAGIVIGG